MPFLKSNVPIPLPFIQFILQKTDPCWWIKTLHLEYWDSNHRHCFLKCIISKSKTKTTVSTYLTRLEPRVKQMMQNLMRLELGLQVLLDLDIDKNAWGAFLGIQALEKISHCNVINIIFNLYNHHPMAVHTAKHIRRNKVWISAWSKWIGSKWYQMHWVLHIRS